MLVFIILLGLFLRIYKLDEIPGELWGDVNEHMIYGKEILKGDFYWSFFGGDGPIFDYLTALFFLIFGKNFLAIKLTTVFIGLLILYFSYLVLKNRERKACYLFYAFFNVFFFLAYFFFSSGKTLYSSFIVYSDFCLFIFK